MYGGAALPEIFFTFAMTRKVQCPFCFREHDFIVAGSVNDGVRLIGGCQTETGRQVVLYYRPSDSSLYYSNVYVGGTINWDKRYLCRKPRKKRGNKPKDDKLLGISNEAISLQMVGEKTGEMIPV